jgi:predicted kinase
VAGKVRRCHGDLHLRNICLLDGKPVLFDCIEFSDEIASIDVLYDLAFLLMDLEYRNLQDLANQGYNRYLDLTNEDAGLATLPLFISLRAAVRAHVTATAANCVGAGGELERKRDEARRYLDFARRVLKPQSPRLIAIGGLSGSGKSTIARALAPTFGTRPGARVLRSDVIRKRLWGVMPESRLPSAAYAPDVSRRVYDAILERAAAALRAGYCAIIDAVSLGKEERRSFAFLAEQARVPFSGIWLGAAPEIMVARLGARHDDASDASAEVLGQQLQRDPGPIDWPQVDVGGGREASLAAVRHALGLASSNNYAE